MVSLKEIIGQNLKNIRKAKGLSQTDVAMKMGVIQAQYSRIESARGETTSISLEKVAKALGVPVVELVFNSEIKNMSLDEKLAYVHIMPEEDKKMVTGILDMLIVKNQEANLEKYKQEKELDPYEKLARLREAAQENEKELDDDLEQY